MQREVSGYFASVDITMEGYLDGVLTNITTPVDFFLAFDCTNVTAM
jgi:hypothetical protein